MSRLVDARELPAIETSGHIGSSMHRIRCRIHAGPPAGAPIGAAAPTGEAAREAAVPCCAGPPHPATRPERERLCASSASSAWPDANESLSPRFRRPRCHAFMAWIMLSLPSVHELRIYDVEGSSQGFHQDSLREVSVLVLSEVLAAHPTPASQATP